MARRQNAREHAGNQVGQKTFGSFLKRKRASRGLSRHSLAILTGIQERVLADIELNQYAPSYGHLKILGAVLEIPEEALLEVAGCIKQGD